MAQVGYAALSVDIGGASVLAADDAGMEALRIASRLYLTRISRTSRAHLAHISPISRAGRRYHPSPAAGPSSHSSCRGTQRSTRH